MTEYKILNKRDEAVGYIVYAEDGAIAIYTKSMEDEKKISERAFNLAKKIIAEYEGRLVEV